MNDFYRLIRARVETAATRAENINADGSINWNFVDADVFMETNPTERCVPMFYELFNKACENFVNGKAY